MRNILYKNLTSADKKKRVVASIELAEKEGVRTKIIRHFLCFAKEVAPGSKLTAEAPTLRVIKEKNNKEQRQSFFCRIKGSVYTYNNDRIYQVNFVHSLKIRLKALSPAQVTS